MSLLSLFIFIIVLGIITWAVITYLPLPQAFKTIILTISVCVAIYYILAATGILGSFSGIKVPTVR